ncbi:hypothetical protein DOT_4142 [Desulfosporosinus sp. OT]|nr:hypothetical protein DOT_4142 [Desulfosporosinus sp. OT]
MADFLVIVAKDGEVRGICIYGKYYINPRKMQNSPRIYN